MQGSVRAVKAAPKLHNYNSTRNKNSRPNTQKYTHIKNRAFNRKIFINRLIEQVVD